MFLNKLGINKNIYNFKFLKEDKKCVFLTDVDFNEFVLKNLKKISLLTTETGNVIDKINKNTKFCDIENNFINIIRDLSKFIGLDEYIKNISAPQYKEITNEQFEKIEKLFITLHIEGEKYLEDLIYNKNK